MKILLLGATGRTGKLVLDSALEKGYQVNCLARNTSRIIPRENLTLFQGDVTSPLHLAKAMTGCESVISVLNISRKSDFPWSALRTPENLLSTMMKALLLMTHKAGVKRIIICSAWGVAETEQDIPGWFAWLINNSNIGAAYRDHQRQEELLTASAFNWTIVRPVGLTNSRRTQLVTESHENNPKPSLTISRQAVADYLVESLSKDELIGKKVVISGK